MQQFDLSSLEFGLFTDNLQVKIHPLVPAILIDHYMHLNKNQMGIGLIYGKNKAGVLHITNAIGLSESEDNDPNAGMAIDKDLGIKSHNLATFLNSSEKLIGVFQLQKKLTLQSYGIYSMIMPTKSSKDQKFPKFKKIQGILDMPLLMTLDPRLENDRMDISVYTNFRLGACKQDVAAFQKVQSSIDVQNKNKNGLDMVIAGQQDYDTLSTLLIEKERSLQDAEQRRYLLSNPERLLLSVQATSDILQICKNYARDAADGKIQGQLNIAKALSQITRTGFGQNRTQEDFQKKKQLFLMIQFLTEMCKTQTKLGERISAQIY